MTKQCTQCFKIKYIGDFHKRKLSKDGHRNVCKECRKLNRFENREELNLKERIYYKKYHWRLTLKAIKARCNNKNDSNHKYYGGRGIKCLITAEELKELWFRDKAYLMKWPTIDRKENDGNYEFNNCEYIEMSDNVRKRNINKGKYIKYCKIGQYTKEGTLIKIWDSQGIASLELGIDQGTISKAIKNGYSRYGFYWKNIKEVQHV